MAHRTHLALAAALGAGMIATGAALPARTSPRSSTAPDPTGGTGEATPGPAGTPTGAPEPTGTPTPAATPTRTLPVGDRPLHADIKDVDGRTVGSLDIKSDQDGKPSITVTVTGGLPAGFHGFHLHAKGVCDPGSTDPATGSPFFSAGGHVDFGAKSHPDHAGDLPDLLIGANGTGSASSVTDRLTTGQLTDADGSAVVIHAMPDNRANIPDRYGHAADTSDPEAETTMTVGPDAETLKSGDSGGRIACGVITVR
ncbi:superoxide dismutase family protein [Planobispora takensis]|nr:superoxide dismutase family protein [Planobispora takensis]